MTAAPPLASEAPPRPKASPRAIVGEALRLTVRNAREVMLPMLVVQVPVGLLTAIVTIVCYFTVFEDEPVLTAAELIEDGLTGPLFLLLVVSAVEALFAQVARGATIVAVAEIVAGRRPSLTACLDPAFMRMGGLLLIMAVLAGGGAVLALTLIGLVALPYVAVRTLFAFEYYMLQPGTRPLAAIGLAWGLTRGRFLRTAGAVILTALMIMVPVLVISTASSIRVDGRTANVFFAGGGTLLTTVLLIPGIAFLTATTTLLYLRFREEECA